MSGQVDNRYGQRDTNGVNETIVGDKDFTGLVDINAGELILPILAPVNAVAATLAITVGTVPADYVANVNAYESFQVKGLSKINIFSSLTTALVGDNNDLKFTSKALGVAGDAIEIKYVDPGAEGALAIGVVGTVITVTLANSAVPAITTLASEIKALIEADEDANALVGVAYPVGNDGSGVVTALAQTPLASGQNADAIVFDAGGADEVTYTFVANSTPILGANEIKIGATADAAGYAEQCANIVATGNGATRYTIHASTPADALFQIRTTIAGTAGDGDVATTVDGTRIDPVGTGVVANGVDEVLKKTTLNGIEYIYYDSVAGDDPTVDYPDSIPVDTKATQALTATELATQIATDTDMASAVAVGTVVTATWGIKGIIGNAVAFADGTGGNVTAAATMSGGVNGTPGMKGMEFYDATINETWKTSESNYTITQSGWYNTANSASVSLKQDKPLTGQTAPASETKAILTRQTAITFIAKAKGTAGHSVSMLAVANDSDALALDVTGNVITIKLANSTTTKNTMTLIAALIAGTPAALALVYPVALVGATEMTAFSSTALSGGLNGTAGAFNQVIQTTDGNKYTQISPYPGSYYWAVDGFPTVNTEYIHCFDGMNGIIYKKKVTGTTATATTTTVAHGIYNWNRPYFPLCSGFVLGVAAGGYWAGGGYSASSTAYSQLHGFGVANYVLHHGTQYQGQVYIESLYYSKTF